MTRSPSNPPPPDEGPPTLPVEADRELRDGAATASLREPDRGRAALLENERFAITAESEGRYQIQRELATGGQAWVYIAYDTHLGREVAFKQPRITSDPSGSEGRAAISRFLRETRITAFLEHPNIVPVHEIGRRRDGSYYCTQKLIRSDDGGGPVSTLRNALEGAGSLADRLALVPHFLDVCNAVAYAHERGVIHRDIKPDNVVIGRLGETVVLDWGIAKVVSEPGGAGMARGACGVEPEVTEVGQALGTPRYMSPEQAAGDSDRIDERSDVWSLGAVLYELLTGRAPAGNGTADVLAGRANADRTPPVRSLCPEAPAALAAVAEKALARSPEDRYQSAAALAGDISAYEAGLRVGVYRYSLAELLRLFVARHRKVTAVVVIAAVLLAVAAAVAWWNYGKAERYLAASQTNLALAFVEKARRAERQLQWDRAAAYYAAARAQADRPEARWGAMLTKNRPHFQFMRLSGHPGDVTTLAVSPEGLVAGTGASGTITLWDGARSEPRAQLHPEGTVYRMAFSPDGDFLATVGDDRWLAIWPLDTLEPRRLLRHDHDSHALAFSPDGERIALATGDASLIVYDRDEDRVAWEASADDTSFYGVEYTRNGEMVVVVGWDRTVRFFDAATGDLVREIPEAHEDAVLGVRSSPGADVVATAGRDGLVKLWRIDDGSLLHSLAGHTQRVSDAAFSPDGELLATSSTNGTIKLWDAARGRLVVEESYGHDREVSAIAFSPPGDWFAFASEAVWLRRVDETSKRAEARIESIAASPDGSLLAHSFDHGIHVRDLSTGEMERLSTNRAELVHVTFSRDGATFVARCDARRVCAWDVATKEPLFSIRTRERVLALDIAPDESLIAIGGDHGSITIWDPSTQTRLRALSAAEDREIFSVAFSPDGDTLASASFEGPAMLWDTGSWEPRTRLEGHARGVRRIGFSPDGALAVTASWDRTLGLWDPESGDKLAVLEGHSDFVYDFAFEPAGRYLLSGSWDGTIRIWDVERRRELASFVSDETRVSSVAWLPPGDTLAYAGHAVHVLELGELGPPDVELERILDETGFALRGIELERR